MRKKKQKITVTETFTRELGSFEFFCDGCNTIHKKSTYAVAQRVAKVDLISNLTVEIRLIYEMV